SPGSRRSSRRLALCFGQGELAAELDREAEGDVLVDHPEGLDPLDAARAEPLADAVDELLRRRRARGDVDRTDTVEPSRIDLRLVVDQIRDDPPGGAQ